MHANPDDDFCDPKVGMNESIVDKYIQEGEKIVKEGGKEVSRDIVNKSSYAATPTIIYEGTKK